MKTNIIRAAVFTLVFAGFSASTVASLARHDAATKVLAKGGPGTCPTPACGPWDKSHCGSDE